MGWFGPPTWGEKMAQEDRRRRQAEARHRARARADRIRAVRHPVRHQLRKWGWR